MLRRAGAVLLIWLAIACGGKGANLGDPGPNVGRSGGTVGRASASGGAGQGGRTGDGNQSTGGGPGGSPGSGGTSGDGAPSGADAALEATGGSTGSATGGQSGSDAAAGPASAPATVVIDGQALVQAKQKLAAGDAAAKTALTVLLALADPALTAGPWSVMDKTTTPPSGSKHDYISLARYYWPTGTGCPYVHKDGETNPDTTSDKYDHASRHAAMDAIYHLAMAWYFTDDPKYAARAALVARTWFLDPKTAMNPNINFGEGVPCLRNGTDTGVLNWTEVIGEVLDGVAVLDSGAPGWTTADQTAMRAWLTAFLAWLQTNALGTSEASATNNHGTWYDVGAAAIMLYLGQQPATRALVEKAQTKRLASQIKSDGSQPEELARTNTWGYSNWNLEGFCRLAATGRHVGVDLWAFAPAGGGTLAKAVDYLIAGAKQGKAAWAHPQIIPLEPSWAIPLLHAAADFAIDAGARDALPLVPPAAGGDLWPLLPVCTTPAIQVN
jgi:hypothetical protein